MDMDAAGGVATAGLVAAALEKPTGEAGEAGALCTDCGEPVSGRFCSNCGQPTHVHRSLLHLGEEMLHGVMHFDARIWRTLPLLALNPGRLTREWVAGKRTRYVSPLALFLFTVFLTFFALSFSGRLDVQQRPLEERIAIARTAVVEAETELARARTQAGRADSGPGAAGVVAGAEGALEGTKAALLSLERARTSGPRADGLSPGSWQAEMADAVQKDQVQVRGDRKWVEKVKHKLANPDLLLYKIQQTAYKFSFLLIPLSIPFVALLFLWRRGFTLYDHGVFVLYSLTAMSILVMITSFLAPIWTGFAVLSGLAFTLGVPAHMFAQLKGAYQLSWFSAAWRTMLLLLFCVFVLTAFVVSIIMLGLAG